MKKARRVGKRKKPTRRASRPAATAKVRRVSVPLHGYTRAIEDHGHNKVRHALRVLEDVRKPQRIGKKKIVSLPTPNPVSYIPPRGRGKRWTRVEVAPEGSPRIPPRYVSEKEALRGTREISERAWTRAVASSLDLTFGEIKAWRKALYAEARAKHKIYLRNGGKGVSLKRRYMLVDFLIKKLGDHAIGSN